MSIPAEDRIAILLNRLDFHTEEIRRRGDKEMQLFEWSTALLLAVFAIILALPDSASQLQYPTLVKVIATLLILFPTAAFAIRILGESKSMARQAEVIDRLEAELHFFDPDYYFAGAPLYPERWHGNLARAMLQRKTPIYLVAVMGFMLFLVISMIWITL